ncbi:hypothetical protein Bbelb_437870 [Branchiostoma belcheri]|nr:hypothetical protein Bbelb_437870 [Branchiostoma belcheri]
MAAPVCPLELELLTRPDTPLCDLIDWMQERGLLATSMDCNRCPPGVEMEFRERADVQDEHTWRCPRCSTSKSIRAGSLFAEFPKIHLRVWLRFLFKWMEDKLTTNIKTELETVGYVSKTTLLAMCRLIRYLCARYLVDHPPIPMGGPNVLLQMDESCFRKKPKYGRGQRSRPIWVFGIVRTDVQPAVGYMQVVERRDAATLLPIIQRSVLPGSTVYSDEWAAYRNVALLPNVAQHHTVNHSLHFVDPVTGIHTQHIEAYWSRKKEKLRRMHGCYGPDTQSYLNELMWRERVTLLPGRSVALGGGRS